MDLQQSFQQAMALLSAGRLAEAEALALRIQEAAPEAFQARHLLGLVRLRQGRGPEALAAHDAALALAPGAPTILASRGMVMQAMGRWADALADFDGALAARPDNLNAWYNRAVALRRLGHPQEALESYDRVLALDPGHGPARNNRGNALRELNRPAEALADFDAALALRPGDNDVANNRGVTLLELHRPGEALAGFEAVLARDPRHAEALYLRANALAELERLEEALESYDRALAVKPDHGEALYRRASLLHRLWRLDDAVAAYDRALTARPGHFETLNNRGVALLRLQRDEEALASFDRALAIKPASTDALNNRGTVLKDLGRFAEALASFEAALAIDPGLADVRNNHGVMLWELNRAEEAVASFNVGLARDPGNAELLHNRGNALNSLRRVAEAAESFEAALASKPDHRFAFGSLAGAALSLCDWPRAARSARAIPEHIARNKVIIPPLTLMGYSDAPALLLENARANAAERVPVRPPPLWRGTPRRRDKIRLAYVSADFRAHPVAYQIASLIEAHDRDRFDVAGISLCENDGSAIRARLDTAFGGLHDASLLSPGATAALLHARETDIVIDLTGHTLGTPLRVLSYRPAPVQVNYLGYPGTLGADFVDYILADRIVAPFEQQAFFTERIVHLPGTFFPTERRAIAPAPSRRQVGLPEQGFVFCCFNNNWKIMAPVFDIWARLLAAMPGSVLWLREETHGAADNLRQEAAARGLDPARLVFAPRLDDMADHLARYRLADLFLDTQPYNAHATACDALWGGLPVLTCLGQSFAGRVAASLLHAAGLPELVTQSPEEYETLALGLARDPARLGGLRQKLDAQRLTCALFDTARLCRGIETAYTTMHETARTGAPPRGFAIAPEPLTAG